MSQIWTEKYRPKEFLDFYGQEDIVSRAKAFVTEKNMPHLMFTGPAGTGKSTLSLIIVKKLYGENWRSNYLELNASDERGIDVVREKVKDFARTKSLDSNFKIIFLDEADALTREAQQALRRTMEMFTQTCRFILSCNYSSKIIEPIQSRCAVFRFKQLDREAIEKIVKHIAEKENLQLEEGIMDELFMASEGDCRRLVNILQASAVISKSITSELIGQITKTSNAEDIRSIIENALAGNFSKSKETLLEIMLIQSLQGIDIIRSIMKLIPELKIDDRLKVRLIEKCGEAEFRLVEGSDDFIQLEALLASFATAGYRSRSKPE